MPYGQTQDRPFSKKSNRPGVKRTTTLPTDCYSKMKGELISSDTRRRALTRSPSHDSGNSNRSVQGNCSILFAEQPQIFLADFLSLPATHQRASAAKRAKFCADKVLRSPQNSIPILR